MLRDDLQTWGTSRGNRLECGYPAGYPLHATICTWQGYNAFVDHRLALEVFRLVVEQEYTLAACLMPDHLHWLLADASRAPDAVSRFKSLSTRVSWQGSIRGRLWQRSYWDHVIRRQEDLREVAEYIIQNPVRAGLVRQADEYPWQIMKL